MDRGLFNKYKYVYAVFEEGNITKAAQKLFISQPSLSAAIKSVEDELGSPLFDRGGNGVRLTQVGEAYIETCKEILRAEHAFDDRLRDMFELKTGTLAIGATNYLSCYILPRILTRFRKAYPHITLEPLEAHSTELSALIAEEKLDLVIDSFDESVSIYQGYPLRSERIFLCVPEHHPINQSLAEYRLLPNDLLLDEQKAASVPPVPVKRLQNEPFVLLKKGNDMRARAEAVFAFAGIAPPILFEADQMNISHAMVEAGMGVCFVTDTLVRYGKLRDGVVLYNVDGSCNSRTLYAAHKKNRYCSRAMQAFIRLAQEELREK